MSPRTPSLGDEQLDALLAGSGPLEDGGFTARVMEALPPRAGRQRGAIVLVAATLGGLLAALPTGRVSSSIADALAQGTVGWALAALLLGGIAAALAGTAAAVARAES